MEYQPDDVWPPHQNASWNDTFEVAQAFGWTFESSGHFGRLRCPSRECVVLVYSTGAGTETVARNTAKKVDRCTHNPRSEQALGAISARLVKAGRLVDAAESLIAAERETHRAELLLEAAEELLGEEAMWDDLGKHLVEADLERATGARAFADLGIESVGSEEALDLADTEVKEAVSDLKAPGLPSKRVAALKREVADMRGRINALRR